MSVVTGEHTPAQQLASMDFSVAVINEIIDGTTTDGGLSTLTELVEFNVRHLELMIGPRLAELGDSPDLSSYEAAIAAGNAYEEAAA